jgi:hypothetical protein
VKVGQYKKGFVEKHGMNQLSSHLVTTAEELDVKREQIAVFISDRASINISALQGPVIQTLFPDAAILGCMVHTLNHHQS